MNVHYISPSCLPSRTANSIHVVSQTRALADAGAQVTLYACRSVDEAALPSAIRREYGVDPSGIRLVTTPAASGRAVTARIALLGLRGVRRHGAPDLIIARNLYAAFALAVLAGRPLIYEVHDIEGGVRGRMQRAILEQAHVRVVAISKKLEEFLRSAHRVTLPAMRVLHDAAPAGITPLAPADRRSRLVALVPEAAGAWRGVCGYFGQLYTGRGIEIIEQMAGDLADVMFLVFGGSDADVRDRRRSSRRNLLFPGHVPHQQALELARCMDVLLMPYQARVSIGVDGRDTARWMSPMKMFEYMAAGVPLISSDLPVLREVLEDGVNSLLVAPADAAAWSAAANRLFEEPELAERISANAHAQYRERHTWQLRARALLAA